MAADADFSAQIRKFARKSLADAEVVRKKVSLDIFHRTIMRTPVGDPSYWKNPAPPGYTGGSLRANWQAEKGDSPPGEIINTKDTSGSSTRAQASRVILGAESNDTLWLINNLPYVRRVEYEGWSPRQAPQGMVRVSIGEFKGLVKKRARGSTL